MNTYEIESGIPTPEPNSRPNSLTSVLRRMKRGESTCVTAQQRTSVHGCARRAGVKIRTSTQPDGTLRVWRIDGPEFAPPPEETDIFGQPLKKKDFPK